MLILTSKVHGVIIIIPLKLEKKLFIGFLKHQSELPKFTTTLNGEEINSTDNMDLLSLVQQILCLRYSNQSHDF